MSKAYPILMAPLALAMTLFGVPDARAQGTWMEKVAFEVRAGVNVPTFDIADVAEPGPSFGVGVAVPVAPRIRILGDVDFGFHGGKDGGPDVNVYHYMGKIGVDVLPRSVERWTLRVNAGAGAMSFDVDAPGFETKTYFAINVGAKVGYDLTDRINVFLSPQGDIAFTDKDVLTTDNAWVWPFSAGAHIRI